MGGGAGASAAGFANATGTGAGANGTVTLAWISCDYDLAVTKTVDNATPEIGSTVQWTVTVANLGPDAMTRGDTVTLTDSLPGAGAKTITSIAVTGGSNGSLERGAVSCDATVGDAMPATLTCSRPFQPLAEVTPTTAPHRRPSCGPIRRWPRTTAICATPSEMS
ncbi:MAG: hypothetical protein ACOH1T_12005 [Microbacteriaceae bacterium]